MTAVVWTAPIVAIAFAGCAGLDVRPLGSEAALDAAARGIRYYQPAPFLLVTTDNKGGLSSQIVYLPDTTQKMSAQPYSFAAKNDVTLKFESGVMTSASVDVDETVLIKSSLDVVKDVLAARAMAGAARNAVSGTPSAPAPSLFKIVVRSDSISLIGGQGVDINGRPEVNTSAGEQR